MVVEADESDRSFLHLLPTIAVVTNIDREHLDHYGDLEDITSAFASFMNKVPFYGAVVACVDPPWQAQFLSVLPRLHRRVVTYGIETGADVTASKAQLNPEGATFDVEVKGKVLGPFSIRVPGRHNVQNALAAVAVGLELDLNAAQIREGLEDFRGADRRFQVKAKANGVTLIDDYGHHPSEIRATLDAARLGGWRRIWVVFQPHRYTRTKFLMDDFAGCFAGCDRVYVLDIYPASEPPIAGITSERLVERMRELGLDRALYVHSEAAVLEEVLGEAGPGDLIMTIGAGSIAKLSDTLAEAMRRREKDARGKVAGDAAATSPLAL